MSLRLALLGTFHYPVPQGSQLYAGEQARALQAAGARVTLLCYGRDRPGGEETFELLRGPAALSPRRMRAGASPAKAAADAALLRLLIRATAGRRFHAVLAHNAEAALVALAARAATGVPVIYVAHTLWRYELPSYGPARMGGLLAAAGASLDRGLARRVDGLLALGGEAARRLVRDAGGPVAVIPPGLQLRSPPTQAARCAACGRHGVEPGRFVLYAGNLDRYQDLADLAAAAECLPGVDFLAATHDPDGPPLGRVRIAPIASAEEGRALTFAAGVCVLPRRGPGGFPVKLLNYMEARRPIVARTRVAEGLVHERSALLLGEGAGPAAMASSIARLLDDPVLAASLGRGAAAQLKRRHAWPALAAATLELVAAARRGRATGR